MIRLLCFQFLSPTTSASQSAYHTVHVSMLLFMSFVWSDLEYNPTTYTMWVATPSSRGSSQPRDWTQVSHTRASLVAQSIKNLPAMWETRVQSLGQKYTLEKGWLPTPVSLPGEFHGQRRLMSYSSWYCWVRHISVTNILTICICRKHKKIYR